MKQLQILDASIKKWHRIAIDKKEGDVCDLCVFNDFECGVCIIKKITKMKSCLNTPFYDTSDHTGNLDKQSRLADNLMLSMLYEVRLEYINGYHKGIYK